MGLCWSGDVEGGKQAVGGSIRGPTAIGQNSGGPNDAVDHFLRSRGLNGLVTQIEVYHIPYKYFSRLFFFLFCGPSVLFCFILLPMARVYSVEKLREGQSHPFRFLLGFLDKIQVFIRFKL